MKTAIIAPSFLDGLDPSQSSRLARTIKWLIYYQKLKGNLSFEDIFLSDDGSSDSSRAALSTTASGFVVLSHPKLSRQGSVSCDYPWCWRALFDMRSLIEFGFEKIIMIDTDTFVLTQRMVNYLNALRSGWTSFHLQKYDFPSAELHILCEDAFPRFLEYTKGDFMALNGKLMERELPFTKVVREFVFDRYGETRTPQTAEMDAYSQTPLDVPMKFGMK